MSDWLPLVMPRSRLFQSNPIPDLTVRNRPEILETNLNRGKHPGALTGTLLSPQAHSGQIGRHEVPDDEGGKPILDGLECTHARTLFHSLSLVTGAWVFDKGCPDGALHRFGSAPVDTPIGIVARTFLSYNAGNPRRPLYRIDKMEWHGNVPTPDLSDLDPETPVQVIIPIERPTLPRHRQIKIASLLGEDLSTLGDVYGWGTPHAPRWIEMPEFFA